jgi:uncharacterized protein (TIRG00374 family)
MTKSKPFQILQYLLLLGVGGLLCWLFFRNLDVQELKDTLREGNYFWLIPVFIVSVLTYILRVARWQMLIKAAGFRSTFAGTFSALSIGYFVNLVVPRLGEVTRCLSVKKQEGVPFLQLLGTVIVERVVDIVSLIIVLGLTLALQFEHITTFARENIFQPLYDGVIMKIIDGNLMVLSIVAGIILLIVALIIYFRRKIAASSPKVVSNFIKGLKDGLRSIVKLEKRGLFIFYSAMIWVCYFYMTYFWFFVFKETVYLGWGACMAIVTIGTMGRSVPIQGGGMGAYHFLVTHVAMIYGVTEVFGKTLATLIHAGQTIFTLAMGLVGLIIFFARYWKKPAPAQDA